MSAARGELIQPVTSNTIRLEACSACQLRCPSCPTTTGASEAAVGRNRLKLADFVALVDANPWIGAIELSNYGEVFLNPDLLAIFRHAFARNVTLTLGNGVNLNHVDEDVLEGLVLYQVASLRCSIDGASVETYRRYRVRGDFDAVISNLHRLNDFKRQHGTELPRLVWQFIAFGHNEHEIEMARAMAAELGMEFQVKLNWDDGFSPVSDQPRIRTATGTGAATRAEYRARHQREYLGGLCDQLWNAPQVNWDGKVLGCCRNFWGDFGGNAFGMGLLDSLNHEKIAYARAMLEGRSPPRPDLPCMTCEIYTSRAARADWFRPRPPWRRDQATAAACWARSAEADMHGADREAVAWARITLQVQPGHVAALERLALAAGRAGRIDAADYYHGKAVQQELLAS